LIKEIEKTKAENDSTCKKLRENFEKIKEKFEQQTELHQEKIAVSVQALKKCLILLGGDEKFVLSKALDTN
jgi:hypothetical protein